MLLVVPHFRRGSRFRRYRQHYARRLSLVKTTGHRDNRLHPECIVFPTHSTVRVCTNCTHPSIRDNKRHGRIECKTCVGGCWNGNDPGWVCGCNKSVPRFGRRIQENVKSHTALIVVDH